MRILVTGGAGYVGFPLCTKLAGHGHDVFVMDNFVTTAPRAGALEKVATVQRLDITSRADCDVAVATARPDVVIHLAALHFIPECNRRPVDAVRINVVGTQNILDACAHVSGISRVLITSSAAVYPISDAYLDERMTPAPTDIYGITKAVNEWQARRFAEATGVTAIAVRLFNVFGPGETNPHVIPEIIDQLRGGSYTLRLGNVSPKRCYVYIDDVVDGFESLIAAPMHEPFAILNLGTAEEASVEQLIDTIAAALGITIALDVDDSRRRASDRLFLRCNPSLMTSVAGWTARYSIEAGLRRLLEDERLL